MIPRARTKKFFSLLFLQRRIKNCSRRLLYRRYFPLLLLSFRLSFSFKDIIRGKKKKVLTTPRIAELSSTFFHQRSIFSMNFCSLTHTHIEILSFSTRQQFLIFRVPLAAFSGFSSPSFLFLFFALRPTSAKCGLSVSSI